MEILNKEIRDGGNFGLRGRQKQVCRNMRIIT